MSRCYECGVPSTGDLTLQQAREHLKHVVEGTFVRGSALTIRAIKVLLGAPVVATGGCSETVYLDRPVPFPMTPARALEYERRENETLRRLVGMSS